MEEFQTESRRFEAETREEVQRLRDLVSRVWSPYFTSINYYLLSSSQIHSSAWLQLVAWHLGETGKSLLILFAWACSDQPAIIGYRADVFNMLWSDLYTSPSSR
jgi:hypothetical protein